MSKSVASTLSMVTSGTSLMPVRPSTAAGGAPPSTPAIVTEIPARRRMSTTVTVSISSNPCANGTTTRFIVVLDLHGPYAVILRPKQAVCRHLVRTALYVILSLFARHVNRSEEHTSELQSRENLVCRLLLEKKKK